MVSVTVAQLSVTPGNPQRNVDRFAVFISTLPGGVDRLIVLPECYLTGYVTDSEGATLQRAISTDHPSFACMRELAARHRAHIVVGYLEREGAKVYNSSALFSPGGLVGVYRKQHLLVLGADRFVDAGDVAGPVFDTKIGRIGMMVCYDLRFPEAARSLALRGADIIAMPTNWPTYADLLAEHVVRVRALENGVFVAVANRPDQEAGYAFIGRSQVAGPRGEILADAGTAEGIVTVDIDLDTARSKRRVVRHGEYELDLFADRHPELYGALVEPVTLIERNEEGTDNVRT
ncbi:carbon-nitrogen hydrolase family protein [Microbacterium sp. BR1]|uniref:carbon-nitrogen hydrolase family protein n=1 Tax=Microbacterium sp. BR1 TaxID=1070896 RepID=UPI000C2BB552|nr:carbon-nitrogen hydrolase family protein [Microbacterium sp. BR1]